MRRCSLLVVLALAGCPDRTISAVTPEQGRVETKDIPTERRGADILFVIDNSGSMSQEQTNLIANFPQMVTVLEASNGEAALALLRSSAAPIDIILTDVVMPGMSGRDLAVHARRIRPGVPVIFTSGYTDGEIVRRGLLDAADGYLQKPYTPTGVTEFVQSRLGTRTPA